MRIAFLTHSNLYDSKRYFTQCLAKALERAGVETKILDDSSIEFKEELMKIACNPSLTDFTASFNSQTPTSEGKFLCDFTGIPHIFLMLILFTILVRPFNASICLSPV
ncbi:MAG: hypothetical protein HWD61_08645 [Parachlamydiaceae bacterium]|nr:MAG: hypothetical protein HWD61_08645 [Parachlamydiaceae bacterium]